MVWPSANSRKRCKERRRCRSPPRSPRQPSARPRPLWHDLGPSRSSGPISRVSIPMTSTRRFPMKRDSVCALLEKTPAASAWTNLFASTWIARFHLHHDRGILGLLEREASRRRRKIDADTWIYKPACPPTLRLHVGAPDGAATLAIAVRRRASGSGARLEVAGGRVARLPRRAAAEASTMSSRARFQVSLQ